MLLDTRFLIDLMNRDSEAKAKLDELADASTPLAFSVLTVYEVGIGLEGKSDRDRYERVTDSMSVAPLRRATSQKALNIQRTLRSRGEQIGNSTLSSPRQPPRATTHRFSPGTWTSLSASMPSRSIPTDGRRKGRRMAGKMIFNDLTARQQLLSEGEVVTFQAHQRTTGSTWWSETRLGAKEGDVTVEELGEMPPSADALSPCWEHSGFETVDDWIAAIERLNGDLPETGYLCRVTAVDEGNETHS